jgi:hypothetical protein
MKQVLLNLTLLTVLSWYACNTGGPTTPGDPNPVITELQLRYSQNQRSLFISAAVEDLQGRENIDSVAFELYYLTPDSNDQDSLVMAEKLRDDGSQGDIILQDGVYSFKLDSMNFVLPEGYYQVFAQAVDLDANQSSVVSAMCSVAKNDRPQLYLLEAPSIFERGDTLRFKLRVNDLQGQQDIVYVAYGITWPDGVYKQDPTWRLRDDGQFGDEMAGDGIYTVLQPYGKTGKSQGVFEFAFFALDRQGAYSDTLTVTAANPGVTLTSPDEMLVFHAGDTLRISWASAFISELVIQYTIDDDQAAPSYTSIATIAAAIGQYTWIVPTGISSYYCKIRVYDLRKPSRFDESDNRFYILP